MKRSDKRFPTFAWILLVIGVLWLLGEIGVISSRIPWIPVIVIVIAIGWIVNRSDWCCNHD